MTKPATSFEQLTAHNVFHHEVVPVDGALPKRVQLMAYGTHKTRNGLPPVVSLRDREHAEAVIAASSAYAGPNKMVIDYDHQTVRAAAVAGQAKAAGWIGSLVADDTGIWGEVDEWTAAASQALTDKEYRYVSPFFGHQRDGTVTRIFNVGLTNTPNLDLAAVASAILPTNAEHSSMIDLKALASALGLGENADEAAILAAIARNKALGDTLTATASIMGVSIGDDLSSVASAFQAKAGNPDPSKFVPVTAVAEMQSAMSALQVRIDGHDAEKKATLISDAKASGKLPPALEAHAQSLELTALASFLSAMPETGLGKALLPGGGAEADPNADLTADELAVASAFGLTPEEFKAQKAEAN